MVKGRVINLNGGTYKVLLEDGSIKEYKARGKLRAKKVYEANIKSESQKKNPTIMKTSPKVGDIVIIENDMIEDFLERKNSLIRPDIANVDQIILVFAAKEPNFSFTLLDLFLINLKRNNIKTIIVITKIDLLDSKELNDLKDSMNYYSKLGYDIYYMNNLTGEGKDEINEILHDKISILTGQTGAGKSSLLNSIIPGFNLKTQEISSALGRGKHTTREISLYPYLGGLIGDTPGFSKLDAGLIGLKYESLDSVFIEFKNYSCQFNDCNHLENSLGCGIIKAVKDGLILESRYNNYLKFYKELKNKDKK